MVSVGTGPIDVAVISLTMLERNGSEFDPPLSVAPTLLIGSKLSNRHISLTAVSLHFVCENLLSAVMPYLSRAVIQG